MNISAGLRPVRQPSHRALHRFPFDKRATVAGLAVATALVAASLLFANALWIFEADALGALLRMSDTPFSVAGEPARLLGGAVAGGARFTVPGTGSPIPAGAALGGIAAFVAASIVAIRWRRVPVPAKVLWLLFAAIGSATLWYTGFVSGSPPQPVRSLSIGFQRGGLLTVVVAALLFAFEIFPVPGRLRTKAGWLLGLCLFAVAWSVVRMAVVLATAHHIGPWTFLYLHYLAGPVVDFLTIVAFYSFATYGLSKRLEEALA
ncbi:MAG TPA: hypothetical protein VM841_00820 [Actinomycetota bacterium]|nr:hypothetical protein [Actinomycetota bacterium]